MKTFTNYVLSKPDLKTLLTGPVRIADGMTISLELGVQSLLERVVNSGLVDHRGLTDCMLNHLKREIEDLFEAYEKDGKPGQHIPEAVYELMVVYHDCFVNALKDAEFRRRVEHL